MQEIDRIVIPTKPGMRAHSLCWNGDELVDWVGGGVRYHLDGSISSKRVNYAFAFDRAIVSQDGKYAVIYQNLGTKGLVLKSGVILREINRSFYHAYTYDYPIAFVTLLNGTIAIVHCPEKYWKLEIEDVESGERLTKREGASIDFFQSCLAVSPDNRYLISAGWIWHPFENVLAYNVNDVIIQPDLLSTFGEYRFGQDGVTITTAAFRGDGMLVMTSADEWYDKTDPDNDRDLLPPNYVGVYDLENRAFLSQAPLEETAGTIMPVEDYVVGFFKHPKLISLASGEVVLRWEDLSTGEQNGSITSSTDDIPPMAFDSVNKRFAVASKEAVTIIQLG